MNDVIIRAIRLADDVIAVSLYIWCEDETMDWYPSLHNGLIDVVVLDAQLRAHNART